MALITIQIYTILVFLYLIHISIGSLVTFYEEPNLEGDSLSLDVEQGYCVNIEDCWSERISSVCLQASCVIVWEDQDCEGESEKLFPGTSSNLDLQESSCPMDIRSISLCPTIMQGRSFGSSKNKGPGLWKLAADEHNKYRKRHKSPPLKGDPKISQMSQIYADKLAKTDAMEHSQNSKKGYGENLAWTSFAKNTNDAVKEAVKNWYNEIKFYNFKRGGFASQTGHFTAVVWKKTKSVGIGVAWSPKKKWWVIVANYFPMGNILKQFDANVLKPK